MLGITNSVHTLAGLCAPLVMGYMVDAGASVEAGFRSGYLYAGGLITTLGLLAGVLIDPESDLARFRRVRHLDRAAVSTPSK
jgi:hypothetical protein